MARTERPLDAGDGPLLRFAADLRRLREKAGSPTYRRLANRAHYSVATLATAAAGRKLPSLDVTLAYVRACEGDAEEWERRWREVSAELTADSPAGEEDADDAPYVGLSAFQPEDAERFFGREQLVEELVDRLAQRRFLAVFGASGAGKSSLLRAGLVPRLPRTVLFAPGPHPLEECAIHLAGLVGTTPGQLHDDLVADRRNLHRVIRQAGVELVIIVDQFEEVFTLCRDADERDRFVGALLTATTADNSGCRVVLGVRTDFYTHCTANPELVEALRDAQVAVGPMRTEELRRAITQPAVRAGCTLEGALLADLVATATGQAGVLPLLSHALLETWRRRRGNTLTLNGYRAAGGVEDALAQTAESCFTALTPEQQHRAKALFLRLITLGDGTEDTKRRVSRAELGDDPHTLVAVERLAAARLLTVDRDGVEVAHEALIRCWPRLRGWLADNREGLRAHRQLTEAAETWARLDRDPGALYRGTRLTITQEWADAADPVLTEREREFVDTSRAAQRREQFLSHSRTRRLRRLVGVLYVLLLLTTGMTAYAVHAEMTVKRERNTAISQKVAAQAAQLRMTDPALAAQLALAAYRLVPTEEARSSLLSTFARPFATQLVGHTGNINAVVYSPDARFVATASRDRTTRLWDVTTPHRPTQVAVITGHDDNVNAVAFSPDSRTLATASWDRTVRLWDISDPSNVRETAKLTAHTDDVNAVVFAPDGATLATASTDRTVRLWNVANLHDVGEIATLSGHEGGVVAVDFSPDGRTLATAGWDGTARLWDVTDPLRSAALSTLPGHTAPVVWVDFDQDGRTLATSSQDRTAKLWDVTDPRQPRESAVLDGHTDVVRAVTFGPHRTVVTTSLDRTAKLWDVGDPLHPREVTVLPGHTGGVVSAVFSPDGRVLATASDDETVRLWDVPDATMTAHTSSVCGTAFSPDGRVLATSGWDRAVLLWDMTATFRNGPMATLPGHGDKVCGTAFSPDSRTLATASDDRTVRLWDVTDPRQPRALATLATHTDHVNAVDFSPDGRTLATAGLDATVRLWNVENPRAPKESATFEAHVNGANAVAYGRDGHVLATAGWDNTARLWDLTDPGHPTELATLTGHTDGVVALAFNPDRGVLATAGHDRAVRLWDVTDPRHPELLTTLTGHNDSVYTVSFSHDGRTLATGGADRTVRLWDVADPRRPAELAALTGHTEGVIALAFHPNGHTMATGGADHSVRLRESDPAQVAAHICEVAWPRVTQPQWSHHLPGTDYQPPCDS